MMRPLQGLSLPKLREALAKAKTCGELVAIKVSSALFARIAAAVAGGVLGFTGTIAHLKYLGIPIEVDPTLSNLVVISVRPVYTLTAVLLEVEDEEWLTS